MSIRKKFISLVSPFAPVLPLDILCAATGHDFIIPFYHVVSDEECPHIRHLYGYKSVKRFEEDIDYLARHYQPVGADALPDIVAGKYKGKRIMLLTFDDGLRQMYDIVAPILLRKGIPAVFFLNTDFIDNKGLMFRYKASLAWDLVTDKQKLTNAISDTQVMEQLTSVITDRFAVFLREYKPYMTTTQIQSLLSEGFTIGAHSSSHPYYEYLSLDEQLDETLGSLDILAKDFGITQRLFAFPFTDHGVSKSFFDRIFAEGKVDFSFGGAGIKNDVHPRQFQRIPMEGWSAGAEQTLKSEYLYYMLRGPLGRNTIQRP
jgi:peptidoglycan/xylan/chitin deacetylase (PgdA/CDA1 family)